MIKFTGKIIETNTGKVLMEKIEREARIDTTDYWNPPVHDIDGKLMECPFINGKVAFNFSIAGKTMDDLGITIDDVLR